MNVGLLGLGSWGTALAAHLGQGGHRVAAWTLEAEDRVAIARDRENRRLLPGLVLPEEVRVVENSRRRGSGRRRDGDGGAELRRAHGGARDRRAPSAGSGG